MKTLATHTQWTCAIKKSSKPQLTGIPLYNFGQKVTTHIK